MRDADVRTGGTWTPRQRLKNACIRAVIRAALVVVDQLPARWLPRLGRALGAAVHRLAHRLRRHAREQVRLAMPKANAGRIVAESFRTAGENLARCLLLRRPSVRAGDTVLVPPEARDVLDHTLAARRGCVVMSAHFGPFEYIAPALAELGYSATVVVRESYDPMLNEVVDTHRSSRGVKVIHRGAPNAPLSIVRALRRGRLIGMLPDIPGRVATSPVSLLQAVAPFASGPERIACRIGAPLLAAWLEPLDDAELLTEPQRPAFRLRVARLLTGPGECGATQQMADCVANAVQTSPHHCLWMGMNFQVFSQNSGRTLTRLPT